MSQMMNMLMNFFSKTGGRGGTKVKRGARGVFTLDTLIRRGSRSTWPPLAALSMSIIAIRWLKKRMGPKTISMTVRPGESYIVSSIPKSRGMNR